MSEGITFSSAKDESLSIPGEHLILVSQWRKVSSWVGENGVYSVLPYQHQRVIPNPSLRRLLHRPSTWSPFPECTLQPRDPLQG
ncbi:hypothetical protein MKX08_006166 [Trichoderma sp. CBMAI-0020]|nr:hypothetical protein MKX08_006166 [Trichoderma sp. CBMAI-0020]